MPEGSRWGEVRRYTDYAMLFAMLALFGLGCMSVYSASPMSGGVSVYGSRQLIWGAASAVFYIAILRIGYKNVFVATKPFFVLTLFLLVLLLAVGYTSKGAQRWFNLGFFRFQPSELGKVAFAMMLAHVCAIKPPTNWRNILLVFLLSGVTIMVILVQPNLGSSIVYFVMMFAVILAAGMSYKLLAAMILGGLAMLPPLFFMLQPYQRTRILIFFDPYIDPQGAGYNVIQSRIALGSGGLFGKGFMHGTQGKLHFLPEPHTDFIFSVFAEEFGFIGCAVVLLLFALLLWRIISTAKYTKDIKAKLYCVAIAAWIWFQMTESVMMSMGLAPVTGLPLPLFSYGGSALLSVVIALAIVQSIFVMSHEDRF
ncbi:rod shape-determining protein RodA [Synergistaceae bacterium OttesenSCG-928-D05]|nr:rod shape-determining protein RodA [Synergistaceae bacterium OttesenSCG-928-D05]